MKSSMNITCRRIEERDVEKARVLFKEVQKGLAQDEFVNHLKRFLGRLRSYISLLLFFALNYFILQISTWIALVNALHLFVVAEGVRFYLFWRKFSYVFTELEDLRDLYTYYSHPKRFFLVAEVDGVLAATVGIWKTDEPKVAKLVRMFVHPDYRRMGIATRLMASCQDECRRLGYDSVTLLTHDTNTVALRFYEKAGYTYVTSTNCARLYPHSFDYVQYVKNLNSPVPV